MVDSDYAQQYRFIFDVIFLSLLFLFLMFVFAYSFMKQRNLPVTQSIEVDPREPHSITITFIPASAITSGNPTTATVIAPTNMTSEVAASSPAADLESMSTSSPLASVNHNQTASAA